MKLNPPELKKSCNLPKTDLGDPKRRFPVRLLDHFSLGSAQPRPSLEPPQKNVGIKKGLHDCSPRSASQDVGDRTGATTAAKISTEPTKSV